MNTKTTAYTFAPDAITCKGKTFPVEYALQPSGTVTAFVQLDDRRVRVRFDEGAAEYPAARAAAEAARAAWTAARTAAEAATVAPAHADKPAEVKPAAKKPRTKKERPETIPADKPAERPETISPAEEDYTIMSKDGVVIAQCSHSTEICDKLTASKQEERRETIPAVKKPTKRRNGPRPQDPAKQLCPEIRAEDLPATIPADKPAAPAQEERPETIPTPEVLPVAPAADPKAARAASPEKTFAGTEIVGNGWKIVFDAATQRTRIIFAADPTDAAKKVLDAAGFFYSGRMQSWNKKLTFRAYRAAQFVAQELNAIYSA